MSVMAFRLGRERKRGTLNVTPLIDVLFLLIIFFSVTGTFKRVGELELQLPESSTASVPGPREEVPQMELIVTEEGGLRLNGEVIERPALKGRLREILTDDRASRVVIKAETGVRHGEVVWLLDIVRDAGFTGVGIGTHLAKGPD